MKENTEKKQKLNINMEDTFKNEECLLGFSSQYKTNIFKEEEDIKENKNVIENNKFRFSLDSTAISLSQEYNNLSEINQKRNSDFNKKDYLYNNSLFLELYDKQRKMSSPLCDYLKGSDKYLSRINQKTFDINHSNNFVKKDNFFGANKKAMNTNNNININNNLDNKTNIINNYIEANIPICNEINMNHFQLSNNNNANNPINNFNANYSNNNIIFPNNNYPQQILDINYPNLNDFINNREINNNFINRRKTSYNEDNRFIGDYFNNILNNNISNNPITPNINETNFMFQKNQPNLNSIFFSYNEEQSNLLYNNKKLNNKKNMNIKNKKKHFDKRKGDWNCPNCNNLNFAFRNICNRCKIEKPNNLPKDDD